MLDSQKRFAALAFIAALALDSAACVGFFSFAASNSKRTVASNAPEVISIAAARAMPSGASVTVDGSVSVPSGAFKSGTSDEGFVIQDRSGGLYVRTAANLKLRLQQQVRVTGQLTDSNGLRILVPTDASGVRTRGRGMKVKAVSVPTGQINEATEGRLVQVTGTITKPVADDLPYGYRLFIDDGSGEIQAFIYASTGVDVRGFKPGQRLSVKGFSGQYNDHYEIIPRFQSDLCTQR
jgi:hypothetical protein